MARLHDARRWKRKVSEKDEAGIKASEKRKKIKLAYLVNYEWCKVIKSKGGCGKEIRSYLFVCCASPFGI